MRMLRKCCEQQCIQDMSPVLTYLPMLQDPLHIALSAFLLPHDRLCALLQVDTSTSSQLQRGSPARQLKIIIYNVSQVMYLEYKNIWME